MERHDRRVADDRTVEALRSLRSDAAGPTVPSWLHMCRDLLIRLRGATASRSVRALVVGTALCIASVAVATLILRSTISQGHASPATLAATTIPLATTITTQPSAAVVVHASGAVRSPGVHRLPVGARVVDLLDLAGGPSDDIDLDRINLAAVLVDGQRIWIPRLGEAAPVVAEGATATAGGGAGSSPVDLNHASVDQLDALPGVGPATAAAIVSHREKAGPFRTVDDLEQVRGIGRSKIDALRDLVVCG